MGLNVKNPEAENLVRELAQERAGGFADRLLAIGQDCAPRLKEPFRSADHGDLLYDDLGLPR
jgi:antitoxin VapB